MKIRNLFITLGLALTAAVGVGAGLKAGSKVAKAENEATWAANTVLYIRHNSKTDYFNGGKLFVFYHDSTDGEHHVEYTSENLISMKGDSTNNIYRVVLDSEAKDIEIQRKDGSWGGTLWNYTGTKTIYNGTHNLLELTSWGSGSSINGQFASAGVAHVQLTQPANGTLSVKDHGDAASGEGYYYSDWQLDFSASAVAPYYFNYWTYKSGEDFLPFLGEDRSYNPNTMTNLEGEVHFSAVIGNSATDCDTFQNTFLHMNDSDYDAADAGLCDKIPDGETKDRYNLAKDAYNALHSASKAYFSTQGAYASARARLSAWAVAHGETFTVSEGVGSFSPANVSLSIIETSNVNNASLIIIVISALALVSVGGFFLFRKKREN